MFWGMETRRIPIEHGTVLNVKAGFNPPPVLTDSVDLLASFPSIQRYQKKLSDLDQNFNHFRSIDRRSTSATRFIPIDTSRELSRSTDDIMLSHNVPSKPRPKLGSDQKPPIGTTVASYLDDFQYPQPSHHLDRVPIGIVAEKRGLFSTQTARATPATVKSRSTASKSRQRSFSNQSSEESEGSFEEKTRLSRRKSAPLQVKPKVTITGVSVQDPDPLVSPHNENVPASFYLLSKSRKSTQLNGNTPQGPPKTTNGTRNGSPSTASSSYRTVLKLSKNRDIVPGNEDNGRRQDGDRDRPMPQSVFKRGEVNSRSTAFVEKPSPEHFSSLSPSDRSTSGASSQSPDLLKVRFSPNERQQEHPSPESIRKQCDEIYKIVNANGCEIPQNFGGDAAGSDRSSASPHQTLPFYYYSTNSTPTVPESGYNTLKDRPALKRMPSNGSTTGSIRSTASSSPSTSGLPPMQHPLQINFDNFDKWRSKNGDFEDKDAEFQKLQRDLYDAQVCNYRLNAQLGQLASTDLRRETSELKKSLKDKSSEIENLKKRLEKAERDRRTLESRQPTNVQDLQGEKRELQIALEREESEKHELFMQINQLIGELADLRGNADSNAANKELKEQLEQLRGQLKIVENEREELRQSTSHLESSKKALEEQVFTAKENLERAVAMSEIEKQKLKQEMDLVQKEVHIKSAALQSLKLAKNEPTTSQDEVDRLVNDKKLAEQGNEEKTREIAGLNAKIRDFEKAAEEQQVLARKNVQELENKIKKLGEEISGHQEARAQLASELTSSTSSSEATSLKQTIQEKEHKIYELQKALEIAKRNTEEAEGQTAEMEEKLAQAEEGIEELQEELQSRDKANREGTLKVENVVSELNLAKKGIATREKELEKEKKELAEVNDELRRVKQEADEHKNAKISVQEDLSKRAAEISRLNATILDLESKMKELEKENTKLIEKASVEDELVTLVNSLQETRQRLTSKEAEVTELRQKLSEQQDETDKYMHDLRTAQSSLDRVEEELQKTSSQESQLTEDKRELEKKTELLRKELNEEIVSQKVEIGNFKGQIETLKGANLKLENEIKDMQNQAESRLEKLRISEMDKSRLETDLLNAKSAVEDLERELQLLKQRVSESASESVQASVNLKKQVDELKQELEAKEEANKKLILQVSELSLLKEALESHKTTINNLRNSISSLEADKTRIESEYHSTRENLTSTESSKQEEVTSLRKDLEEKTEQLKQLTNTALELQVVRSSLNELHSKLEVSTDDVILKDDEIRTLKELLEKKEKELESVKTATVTSSKKSEEVLQQKISQIEAEKRRLEEEKDGYLKDLKMIQEKSAENIRRLTELLTNEHSRMDTVTREKETLVLEKAELEREKKKLAESVAELEESVQKLSENANRNHVVDGGDDELRKKVSELTEENARLAGDLLKQSTKTTDDNENDKMQLQFEQILHQKQRDWDSERTRLQTQTEELESDIRKLNQSKVDLEMDLQRLKLTSSDLPVPKPRRANTSLTNLTLDTLSERSITPSNDDEEVKKLRSELDKQKRLITVLRKKLQQQQVDAHRQSKLSLNNATTNSPFF